MNSVGTSPGLELNGINHNLLRAGSNLNVATGAVAEPKEPYLRLRKARWHPAVGDRNASYQDQMSENLRQELHTFLEVFAIRLESQEAALSDAAKEIRKSSESVICDMQKRFDAFLEQEGENAAKVMGQRRAKLEEAGAAAQRLLQELPVDFAARFQQVESQLLQMSVSAKNQTVSHARQKEERTMEDSLEHMRLAIQLQGLSKGFKSLEERFSAAQCRLSRNEKTSQQALAQARHLETTIPALQIRVEDQASFQNLRRQVRDMSKTFADAMVSVSAEGCEELLRRVSVLEQRVGCWECPGEDSSMKISEISAVQGGNSLGADLAAFADSKDVLQRRTDKNSSRGSPQVAVAVEGLHFADGTVESSYERRQDECEESILRSPKRNQASPMVVTQSRLSTSDKPSGTTWPSA